MDESLPLQTERLVLREFRAEDVEDVHEYASDAEVVRHMAWGPNDQEATRQFVHRKLLEQREEPRRVWDLAVVERDSDRVIGSCGLRMDEEGGQAALGYCYRRDMWGQGLATEAALAVLRFAFEEMDLHRVSATCDARNVSSARVLEKLGMRREGHFIESLFQRERWRSSCAYAILRREWLRHRRLGEVNHDPARAEALFNTERNAWEGAHLQIPESVNVRMKVPYGTGGETQLTTDMFLPPDDFEPPRPAMLYVHGGGWQGGSPTQFYRQAARLAEKGVVGSCCRYRFSGEATFPASVEDVKAAVRWLRAVADEYGIDPERIGAMGGSAGGHLAGMLATTAGIDELEGEDGHTDRRSDVQLGVLLNPITDMTRFVEGTNLHPAAVRFMGGTPEEMPDAYRLASPLLHIDERTPPCLLVHGTDDDIVPHEQSAMFVGAMKRKSLRADVILVDDVGHGFFNSAPYFESVYREVEDFVLTSFGIG